MAARNGGAAACIGAYLTHTLSLTLNHLAVLPERKPWVWVPVENADKYARKSVHEFLSEVFSRIPHPTPLPEAGIQSGLETASCFRQTDLMTAQLP